MSARENYKRLLIVNGGLGRNIMFTSILQHIYDITRSNKIDVCASYPDVFKDIINGTVFDGYYFANHINEYRDHWNLDFEPYRCFDYRVLKQHFVSAWLFNVLHHSIPSPSGIHLPTMKIDDSSFAEADKMISKFKAKKVAIIQLKGGTSYFSPERSTCFSFQERQIRDSLYKTIVDTMLDDGYTIYRYGLPGEPAPKGCVVCSKILDFKIWAALAKRSDKIVCADSSMAHMAAAVGRRAMVLWGATSVDNLGWGIHKNIVRSDWKCNGCGRPDTHFGDQQYWTCRYAGACSNHNKTIVKNELEKYLLEK